MIGVLIRIRLEVDQLARLEPVGQLVDEELQARIGLAVRDCALHRDSFGQSSSRRLRSRASARTWRVRTAPAPMPSTAPISAADISSRYRMTRSSRSFGLSWFRAS